MMTNRYAIAIALLLMSGPCAPRVGAAGREQRPTTWQGLSVIVGHKVSIVMPDGARIAGKATAVEVDALAVEISKTSNKTAYPKGKFLVPRATLKAVDVSSPTRHWRVVSLAVGGGIGVFLAVLAVDLGSFHTRHPVRGALAAGAAGVPVVAYLLGRAADSRTITYVIAP
jgi:hypothetical protein